MPLHLINNLADSGALALPAQPLPTALGVPGVAQLDPQTLTRTAEAAARALLRQGEAKNTQASYRSALRYWCAWYAARYGAALTLPVPTPVVVQFIVDHAARSAQAPAREGTDPASEAPHRLADADPAADPAAPCTVPAAQLVTELPAEIDEALVRQGYKPGPPALNTLMHRISVLSKAHQVLREQPAGGPRASALPANAPAHAPVNPCADPLVRELLARTRRAYAQRGERPGATTHSPRTRCSASWPPATTRCRARATPNSGTK